MPGRPAWAPAGGRPRPRPPQRPHGCENENGPWSTATAPMPPHSPQVSGDVPGAAPDPEHVEQEASERKRTGAVMPRTESSNDRWSSASRS